MRFLVKISFPVEAGNAAVKKNGLKVIETSKTRSRKPPISSPTAAGAPPSSSSTSRTRPTFAIAVQLWFLALNASIEATPAMVAADLQKAAPAIEKAVKTYG